MRPGPATQAALFVASILSAVLRLAAKEHRLMAAPASHRFDDVRRSFHLGLPVQRFHPALEGEDFIGGRNARALVTEVSQTSPGDHPRGITGNAEPNRQSLRISAL